MALWWSINLIFQPTTRDMYIIYACRQHSKHIIKRHAQFPNKGQTRPSKQTIVKGSGLDSRLDIRRNMTFATIVGLSQHDHFLQIKIAHHTFKYPGMDGYAIWPQTLLLKHGKIVSIQAFHKGEQVYIIPPIMENGGGNAAAVADNYADAVRALKKVTIDVTGSIHVTETVQGVVWLDTDKGKTLEAYIDDISNGPIIPGGNIPPYRVNLEAFGDNRIQVRLVKQPRDGLHIIDIHPALKAKEHAKPTGNL